ncbi:MAG: branched-chain amino acid transaminase [Candidatus Nanohaloarchaea archaeon]
MEPVDYIWMDGEMVEWENANVHVLTHALHYGTGVFEGIRAYENDGVPAVFRLDSHMERFLDSAKITGMNLDYSKQELVNATEKIILENELKSCYVRPVAFRGYGPMGLNPNDNPVKVSIAVWPWGAYLGEEALKNGVEVQTASWNRHHPNVMPTKAKANGNYVNSVMAKQEAIRNGMDEAIMLTPEGYVAEGSGENLFAVRNGELLTPPASSVLEGITMDSVRQIAEDLGYAVKEKRMTRDQLIRSDETFFTGTAAEVTPIREIDGKQISDGRGPVTEEIQSEFMEVVSGKGEKYSDWRHRVER